MPYEFPRDAEFLEMLKKTNPPDEFLISRYCNRDKNIFKTKRVFWTYKNERERVAPTVAERKVSVALERDQWDAHECTIPYTGVHRPFTFDVTEDYGYGNAIASDLDFQTKCDRVLLDDARELRESIVRREVLMVASLMQNNAVTLQEVIDDKNAKTPWQIAFYDDGANPAQYTPPMPWTSSAADILADFDAIIDMRKEIHLPTSEFLVSPDVMSYIIRNTEIQNLLDNRRIEIGNLKPYEENGDISFLGELVTMKGRKIKIIGYDGSYQDAETGERKTYIQNGMVIAAAPNLAKLIYRSIKLMRNGTPEEVAAYHVPETFFDDKERSRIVRVTSSSIAVPTMRNAFTSANVLA